MSNSNLVTSRHCLDAAINFANAPQHDGNGYSLRVTLRNGDKVEGPVATLEGQHPDVLLLLEETGLGRKAEVFLDKNEIVTATIVW